MKNEKSKYIYVYICLAQGVQRRSKGVFSIHWAGSLDLIMGAGGVLIEPS